MTRAEQKAAFIHELAKQMVDQQSLKSLLAEAGNAPAKEWRQLRKLTPLQGYPTVEEAEHVLTEFLA